MLLYPAHVRHRVLVCTVLIGQRRSLKIGDVPRIAVGVIALAVSAVVEWVLSWTSSPVDAS